MVYMERVPRKKHINSKPVNIFVPKIFRGGCRISGKGVHMYKGEGARFDNFISLFLNIP